MWGQWGEEEATDVRSSPGVEHRSNNVEVAVAEIRRCFDRCVAVPQISLQSSVREYPNSPSDVRVEPSSRTRTQEEEEEEGEEEGEEGEGEVVVVVQTAVPCEMAVRF
jgi:hypothetical protein